eukprot:TRINITY_DN4396_c0_g3_i1.p1 TRINITY_DN4396_c0_g3~~TRINITY_DN4396_c0_g3_i1.p1  ORF type:complete len:594 (+),score=164.42 TRINITY_DN4396_c0_g3_i1:46-1827(+)
MGACGAKPEDAPAPAAVRPVQQPPQPAQKKSDEPDNEFLREPLAKEAAGNSQSRRRKSVSAMRGLTPPSAGSLVRHGSEGGGSALGMSRRGSLHGRRCSVGRRPSLFRPTELVLDEKASQQSSRTVTPTRCLDVESDSTGTAPDVQTMFALLDAEEYKQAYQAFSVARKAEERDEVERVLAMLGLAVLHNLNGEDWKAPEGSATTTASHLKRAQRFLEEQLAVNKDSPAAWLALSEFYNSTGNMLEERRCRTMAMETGHPLAVLKHASFMMTGLVARRDGDHVTEAQYMAEMNRHVRDLYTVATGKEDMASARAAKMVWGYYYKGKDGVAQDYRKASVLLERILKFEKDKSAAAKYRAKLKKARDKLGEDDRAMQGTGSVLGLRTSQLRSSGRIHLSPAAPPLGQSSSPAPSGGGGRLRGLSMNRTQSPGPSPNLGRRKSSTSGLGRLSMGDSYQGDNSLSRSNSMANSMASSSMSQMVLEINVGGTAFGAINDDSETSLNARQSGSMARRERRGTLTQHDCDPLEDRSESPAATRGLRSGSRMGFTRSNSSGRCGSARGAMTPRRGEEQRKQLVEEESERGSDAGQARPLHP